MIPRTYLSRIQKVPPFRSTRPRAEKATPVMSAVSTRSVDRTFLMTSVSSTSVADTVHAHENPVRIARDFAVAREPGLTPAHLPA